MWPLFFILIALGAILEAVSLRRDPSKVDLEYEISAITAEPGSPFILRVIIANKSRVPISYLVVNEIYPQTAALPADMPFRVTHYGLQIKKVCRVRGMQRKKIIFETSIDKRGVHSFKGDSIEFGDFLGFREISKRIASRREVVIFPEKIECRGLTDALGSYYGDIAARRFLIRDPLLTAGYREYTGREPMKDISWLQSARLGEMMVREYDHNRQISACVVLSVDGVDINAEEEMDDLCSITRAVGESLLELGASVSFYTNARLKNKDDDDVFHCEVSIGRAGSFLESLGRAVSYTRCPLGRLLEYAHHKSDYDAAFVVVLPTMFKNTAGTAQSAGLSKTPGAATPPGAANPRGAATPSGRLSGGMETIERFRNITGREIMVVDTGDYLGEVV